MADKAKQRQLWNDECRMSIVELWFSIIFLIIKIKSQFFGILNFGHCDLFGFCDLNFFIAETRTLAPEILPFLQHVVRENPIRT